MDRGPEYDVLKIAGSKPEVCMDCTHFEEWPALGRDMGHCPKQAEALNTMRTAPHDSAHVILSGMSPRCPLAEWSDRALEEAAEAIVDSEVRAMERSRGFRPHPKPREAA